MEQRNDNREQRRDDNPPVGESINRRAEDVAKEGKEPGRQDDGTKGKTERPVGSSTQRDHTGVNPQEPIDPESPNLIGP